MIFTIEDNKISWIDLESPTEEEVKSTAGRFGLHPLITSEFLKPTLHPKADVYDNLVYLVLYFPFFDQESQTSRSREIDFVIGKDFIVTVHYEKIEPFEELLREKNLHHLRHKEKGHSGYVFSLLVHKLYSFSLRELDHIQRKIDDVEDNIFSGMEKEMVGVISFLSRDILNFRRALHMHASIFESLKDISNKFFGEDFRHYLTETEGEYFRVWNLLENSRETLDSLKETNNSLLSTKSNEIMKILTIMAFVTFPLSLIANIFGMNTKEIPIVGRVGDFWIIILIMSAATLAMFVFFKIKKWI